VIKGSTLPNVAKKFWPILTIIAIVIFILLTDLFEDSVSLRIVGIIALTGFYFSSAAFILRAIRRMPDPDLQRSWRFISIGLLLWLFAYLIEAAAQLISSQQLPIPSVVDLVRYAGLIGIVLGCAIYPEAREKIFGRLRTLLDISILCVGAIIIFWLVVLRTVLLIGLVNTITAVWVEARVCFDLIWMILVLRLFLKSKDDKERAVFLFFGIGAFVHIVVDLFSGFEKINIIDLAPGALEAGWMVAGFLIFFSSSQLISQTEVPLSQSWLPKLQWPFRLVALLPTAVTVLIVGFVVLDWFIMGQLDRVVLPILFLLGFLLIARQGVIAGQSEIRQHAELVNSTKDFAFTINSEGIIRLANPALQTLIGVDPDQKSVSKVMDFLQLDVSMAEILATASDVGWAGEAQFIQVDGTTFPVSLSIRRIEDEGHGQQLFAAIAHDLTETKLQEKELRNALQQLAETEEDLRNLNRELEAKVEDRTQELEDMVSHLAQLNEELKELDQLKSDFVALVSHELRAPLTNIRTGLEVLLQGRPESVQKASESLDLILQETERLSSFVEMILDVSALEAGRFQLMVRPVSTMKIIDDVVTRFSNQPGYDRLKVDIPKSMPLISVDERALHSILFHLIDNALKYAPEGDVTIRVSERGFKVVFHVIDCGPGIPEFERERVFEMFYRLDTSDSRSVYGRGLGLNLAKRFLDIMGGGIQIIGSEEGGTTVEFWLPHPSARE
jgi:PAS domain S-box-containing protein